MSRHERWGHRDRTYSNWHRYACGDSSVMIDVDGLDYCRRCRMPLLLVEAARDTGHPKATIVLETLACKANVPLICILWTPSETWREDPPHCPCQANKRVNRECEHGIGAIRVRHVYPDPTEFEVIQPAELAELIDRIHLKHERSCPRYQR